MLSLSRAFTSATTEARRAAYAAAGEAALAALKGFANEYRDKIHKKIRIAQNDSAARDLAAELEVACQLIQQ